ncbi:dienelactone hydrolase family protein [Alteraurantiacibacter aquimixticola]|uniref:Dienelactone hydrolase family protein n=1 Tax=Alteraurantiacibacter aquimixticola TaxID=2489173 RepID=A0A4T3EZC0_9SPHN|nr:dienelactone hydrolase family protein [Alteraurantiacibacter aquimixticola]TIX50102.1 dienelactone hydrolase family protein [Alteraurantiacibacter aquimixticola]
MAGFTEVSYKDGDTTLTGLLTRPAGTPRAAVLVFPTIMNPTQSVLDKAQDLAAQGYLAMVADFYGKTPESFDQSREFAMAIRQTAELYRQRLRASLKALATLEEAAGLPLAAIGFCMGGQAVLELAREGAPLVAAVSFHGLLNTDMPAEPGAVRSRILVLHGDADPMVPREQVAKFWEEMDRAGADWHFHSYSGVKHGFTNPAPTENPATGYDASADRQSWAAMYSLFDEVLESA